MLQNSLSENYTSPLNLSLITRCVFFQQFINGLPLWLLRIVNFARFAHKTFYSGGSHVKCNVIHISLKSGSHYNVFKETLKNFKTSYMAMYKKSLAWSKYVWLLEESLGRTVALAPYFPLPPASTLYPSHKCWQMQTKIVLNAYKYSQIKTEILVIDVWWIYW